MCLNTDYVLRTGAFEPSQSLTATASSYTSKNGDLTTVIFILYFNFFFIAEEEIGRLAQERYLKVKVRSLSH